MKESAQFGPSDFPIFSKKTQDGHPFVYLDSAATTQKPSCVVESMHHFYLFENATVHRAIYEIAAEATDRYHHVRHKVARFINAASEDEIIFTSGATDALNLIAYTWADTFLQAGDEIVISEAEHHANIVPWIRLCERKNTQLKVIPLLEDGGLDMESFKQILSSNVKLVSVAYTTNTTGAVYPIKEIARLAHQVGAKVVVDGAQAIAHQPIDVQELDVDFFVFSGHKMYGPTGIGVLYGKYALLEKMPPFKTGGDMVEHVSFDKVSYQKPPLRFEAGTPMIAEVIGLGVAIDYLSSLDLHKIHVYEKHLTAYALELLKKIPHVRILGTTSARGSLITFYIQGVHSLDLGTLLSLKGVCVRTGLMCAEPYFRLQGVSSALRISFGVYTTEHDVEYFIKMLKECLYLIKPELSY